ncbi:MAG: hypothetical protein J3Q66DRAFT_391630 [Benniella sp.]|nr:MAG: hypothetical protein J3Q66DRAFT_391630 [Benniella sp.]
MLSNKLTFFSALVLAFAATGFCEPTSKTLTIETESSFCLLMPPERGGDIADNLHRSISFCTSGVSSVPDAKRFPDNFIQSSHLRKKTDRYIQVTGRIDRDAYDLDDDDEGGQNDPKHPVGALCRDYPYFVQFIEPNDNIFCLRCCKNKSDCPTDRQYDGCRDVIGGNYDY